MILKKPVEKKQAEEVNPYSWPENYYMETDPEKRKVILEAQNNPDEENINSLRMELWDLRYEVMRGNKIKDKFVGAWMDLLLMREQAGSTFGKKRCKKQALAALEQLGLTKEIHFGKDLLLNELKHLVLVYCCASMEDRQYSSIIWGLGKMKEDTLTRKIIFDLNDVGINIPQKLEIEQEAALLTEAISLAKEHMGYE